MYNILSSGRKTILNDFDDFHEICTYSHFNDKSEDFQVFPNSSLFSSFNRSSGFELRRIVKKNDQEIIQRVKKRLLNDINAIASSTIDKGDIALGFTNGSIKFFNFKQAEFPAVHFKPDRPNNSVIFLDYSKNCEMLAGIYESGDISLYGLNTNVRMDKIPVNKSPTLLRFNPSKRFTLGIVSYNGSLSVVDAQAKCILFQDKAAHADPCIDFCWFSDTPNNLITVGYDCCINLFDCRMKSLKLQVKAQHPLSSVCVSQCGHYCCVGNLKGDIESYDVRNMKNRLRSQRIHNESIVRVALVPKCTDSTAFVYESFYNPQFELVEHSSDDDISVCELADIVLANAAPERKSIKSNRDSFFDLDIRPVSIDEPPSRRLSIIKPSTDSSSHMNEEEHMKNLNNEKGSPKSEVFKKNVETALMPTPKTLLPEKRFISRRSGYHVPGKFEQIEEEKTPLTLDKMHSERIISFQNISHNNNSTSQKHILLESSLNIQSMENDCQYSSTPINDQISDDSGKENKILIQDLSNIPNRTSDKYQTTPSYSKPKIMSNILLKQDVPTKCDSCKTEIENLKKFFIDQMVELKESNTKQMMELVNKTNKVNDTILSTLQNHIDGATMSLKFQLWQSMEEQSDLKCDLMGLLRNENFFLEYNRMKVEVEDLRQKLRDLNKKN